MPNVQDRVIENNSQTSRDSRESLLFLFINKSWYGERFDAWKLEEIRNVRAEARRWEQSMREGKYVDEEILQLKRKCQSVKAEYDLLNDEIPVHGKQIHFIRTGL